MLRQIDQQAKFGRRQQNQLIVAPDLPAPPVDHQVADVEQIGVGAGKLAVGAAKLRANPREQFAQAVGLGDVIVRAHFQPQHLVGFVALHRQHQDRLAQPQLAHLAAEVEARAVGQAHVEDDQVRVLVAGVADALRRRTLSRSPG